VTVRPRAAVLCLVLSAAAPAPMRAQAPFFAPDSVIPLTIRTDLRRLLRDRDTVSEWRGGTVTWMTPDGARRVPLHLRTRGLYRLRTCAFPPIRLRFAADSVRGTPWEDLRRPKVVTHCRDNDDAEERVVQEYILYRVLRLLTPASLGARLARITWEDTAGAERPVTRYAVITEDPAKLADRLGAEVDTTIGVTQSGLDSANAALLGVFQYFIANTDWSVPGRHNIELLWRADGYVAVPYDFDWSGVIDAPYARPASTLRIRSVRQRVYRGLCQDAAALTPALERFKAVRDSIAALYRAVPGLSPRTVERTLRYYDEFYAEIADRRRFAREVVAPSCLH
jgi:hypothetical protein